MTDSGTGWLLKHLVDTRLGGLPPITAGCGSSLHQRRATSSSGAELNARRLVVRGGLIPLPSPIQLLFKPLTRTEVLEITATYPSSSKPKKKGERNHVKGQEHEQKPAKKKRTSQKRPKTSTSLNVSKPRWRFPKAHQRPGLQLLPRLTRQGVRLTGDLVDPQLQRLHRLRGAQHEALHLLP